MTDTASAIQFLDWLDRDRRLVGVDVETDGLDWFDGQLRLVQFGDETSGWAIPFARFQHVVVEALAILDRRRTPVVGHNFKFDMHFLERNTGWTLDSTSWHRCHDTMLLAGVIDSSGTKALKDLAEFYVHKSAKVGQTLLHDDMKRGGWTWGTVPIDLPTYWGYGVLDTILTVHLFWVLHAKASLMAVLEAYEVERAAMPVLYAIERKGMLVDADHCRTQQAELLERCDEIEVVAQGFGLSNIRSGAQIAECLQRRGVELVTLTDSGNGFKMDSDALDEILERTNDPLAAMVAEYRHGLKMANTYYGNFLKFVRSDDRVHPSYRPIEARTGRMSATNPAVQTLPRPSESNGNANQVRNAFIAPDGHVLISTDFANVEARIFAHFANEEGMIDAIKAGVDLHGYTAKEMYNLDAIAGKDDPLRQIAKSVLFALLFGGGVGRVAITAGVDFATAQHAVTAIHKAFPGIKRFQSAMTESAKQNLEENKTQAFIRGIDGRVLSLREDDDRFYAFTNYMIQGAATVVLKRRLAVIDAMGLTKFCIAAIHDEVVAEVPVEDEVEFAHAMAEAMNDFETFRVPIEAVPGKGAARLGDAK